MSFENMNSQDALKYVLEDYNDARRTAAAKVLQSAVPVVVRDPQGVIIGLEAGGSSVEFGEGGSVSSVSQAQLNALGYEKNVPGGVAGVGLNNEIRANIVPRSNTLAALMALQSGGNELAVATDQPAIVLLQGNPGSGTATVFSPSVNGAIVQEESVGNVLRVGRIEPDPNGSPGYVGVDATYVNIEAGNFQVNEKNFEHGIFVDESAAFIGSVGSAVGLTVSANKMGFFDNDTGVTKPVVSGSRGGNAALASLLTALASLGLISNITSA